VHQVDDPLGKSAHIIRRFKALLLDRSAGTYLVFARSRDAATNGGLPDAAIAGTFRFSLVAGTEAAPGDVRVLAGGGVVDAVTWTGASDGAARWNAM